MSTETSLPLVSAVIPTRNRPDLVCRAVRSALGQTYSNLEVVVVIDGPDPATVVALEALGDARVRIVALEQNVGGSEARNVGAREARGEWVALLDDDDEWLPEKVAVQVNESVAHPHPLQIIACQYIERSSKGDLIRPRRFHRAGQHISEYLFCEVPALRPREGFPQTSTLFIRRRLLVEVPFTQGLKRNQDSDWLLRVVPLTGEKIRIIPTVLAIFHNEQELGRISKKLDWEDSYTWSKQNERLFTPKALSFYLAAFCLPSATRQGESAKKVLALIRESIACHPPSLLVLWFVLRHGIVAPLSKRLLPTRMVGLISAAIHQ